MRRFLLAAVLACVTASAGGGCSKDDAAASDKDKAKGSTSSLPDVSVEELAKGLAAKQMVAVDCNSDKTRKKYGVIPGAIQIYDEEAYAASELPPDKSTKLVFYCSGVG